ncbi:MAG: (deoxy)nucleoside triphosphate pyrophosphohydrolase [Bacteroidales bacterium]
MSLLLRVACAIIIEQGKVFAARRGSTQKQPFKWEFPGGKIEPGETPLQGLLRELSEELGMQPQVLDQLPSFFHQYEDFHIELIPFVCRVSTTRHIAVEHDQTGWFSKQQLPLLQWTAADVPLMEYVVSQVLANYP